MGNHFLPPSPTPDPAPPADGGSQETCSGGRMNLAPILYKSPRVSQNVTLREDRGKLGAPFLPTPQPSCSRPLSFKDLSIVCLNGALPLSPTCSFITLPFPGYTRLLLGHSMSAFIDLYHVYCPRQVASSGKGPTSDRAYTSRDTQQNEAGMCVCVYPCPLHPPRFISDPLIQSSPWSLFSWFLLPGIPLTLASIYPSPSHPSRLGSKAASSKKLFSPLHHHHHLLAFILYHLLSLVSL